MGRAATLQRPR